MSSGHAPTPAEVDSLLTLALTGGPVAKSMLVRQLHAAGVTDKQLRRARERLGVVAKRYGSGARMHSTWELQSQQPAKQEIRAPAVAGLDPLRKHKVFEGAAPDLTPGEATRVAARVPRFLKIGMSTTDAAALAMKLVLERDRPGHRAASCAECQCYKPGGLCTAASYTGGSRNPMDIWACCWARIP